MKRAKRRDYSRWHLLMSYDGKWTGVWVLGLKPRGYREPASNIWRIEHRPRERRAKIRNTQKHAFDRSSAR